MLEQSVLDVVYEDGLEDEAPQLFRFRQSLAANQQSWLYDRLTQQYFVANVSGAITTGSLFYGQTPDITTGTVIVLDLVTSLGYPITPRADGTFSIAAGGDVAPQTFSWNVYRGSAFDGAQLAYVNYAAPIATSTPVVIAVERNQSITPVDLSAYVTDPQGNPLTFAMQSDPPGSLDSSSAGTFAGTTPDAKSITTEIVRATNIANGYADLSFTLIVGTVTVPGTILQSQSAASGLLAAAYLNVAIGTPVNSTSVPLGAVVQETPAQGNEVAPFSTVTIVLSLGGAGPVTKTSEIASPTFSQNARGATLDLSLYATGASVYSVSPPTLSVSDSILDLPLDTVGIFGPFVITATNGSGTSSVTFAPFTYTVVPVTSPSDASFERPPTTLRIFLLS